MLDVIEMAREADRLPESMPEFNGSGLTYTAEANLSRKAKRLLEAFKPLLEKAEVGKNLADNFGSQGKRFELHTKLIMAQLLNNQYRTSKDDWRREATRADTDIPTYARQNLGVILRAYPKLFALQLFPTTVFSQPDGRIYFRTAYYNSNYTGTTTIASGDRLDDITKFNTGFAQTDEGAAAKRVKMDIKSMTFSVNSYRVTGEWTYEAEDDLAAVYGDSLESALVREMSDLLALTTDRTMIDAALADCNTSITWDATPAGYDNLVPSEKKEYDNTIFADGIQRVVTGIRNKRLLTTDPTWCVLGTSIAERFQKLTTFVPFVNDGGNTASMATGIRDIGTLRQLGIRCIVDPMLDTETALFGSLPASQFTAAIHYLPYKALRLTGKVEDPNSGGYEKGVYSRFGVARKDTGTLADSSQLGDLYGKLTVTP